MPDSRLITDSDLLAARDAINQRSTMTVSKETAKAVSEDLSAAIATVLAKHGLVEQRVSIKYGEVFKLSLTASGVEMSAEGINLASPEAEAYRRFGADYGLKPDLLGKTITMRGKNYTFTGLALKRSKYPFAFTGPTGKPIVFTADVVERLNAAT